MKLKLMRIFNNFTTSLLLQKPSGLRMRSILLIVCLFVVPESSHLLSSQAAADLRNFLLIGATLRMFHSFIFSL